MSSKVYKKRTVFVSNPNLRSKTAIRSSDTRYFTDSSIGVILQGKKGAWRAMRLTQLGKRMPHKAKSSRNKRGICV